MPKFPARTHTTLDSFVTRSLANTPTRRQLLVHDILLPPPSHTTAPGSPKIFFNSQERTKLRRTVVQL